MDRTQMIVVALLLLSAAGCSGEPRGPILAGGREVKSWVADLNDPQPKVRRVAVLKLGNVGDTDPSAVEALTGALKDKDALVRRDAILAVAKLTKPTEAIVQELRTMIQSDRDATVRDHAAKALKRFNEAP
jgi:HEAT repeat protein